MVVRHLKRVKNVQGQEWSARKVEGQVARFLTEIEKKSKFGKLLVEVCLLYNFNYIIKESFINEICREEE